MVFCRQADDGRLKVVSGASLPSSTKKKKKHIKFGPPLTKKSCQIWTPLTKLSGSAHVILNSPSTYKGLIIPGNCLTYHGHDGGNLVKIPPITTGQYGLILSIMIRQLGLNSTCYRHFRLILSTIIRQTS